MRFVLPISTICFIVGLSIGPFINGVFRPLIFILSVLTLVALWFLRGIRTYLIFFYCFVLLLGAFRAQLNGSESGKGKWIRGKVYVELIGEITSFPEIKYKGKRRITSFVMKSDSIRALKWRRSIGILEKESIQVFVLHQRIKFLIGDTVRIRCQLQKPLLPKNQGAFDYRKYLHDKNIHWICTSFGKQSQRVQSGTESNGKRWVNRIRNEIADDIHEKFKLETSNFLKALILGMRKNVPQELRDVFAKTGTAHLLAISGLHLSVISGFLFSFLIAVRFPHRMAFLLMMAMIAFYVLLSGSAIPVQRAGWMGGLGFLALWVGRVSSVWNALSFAALIILWALPGMISNVSFQLSFASVLSLMIGFYLLPKKEVAQDKDIFLELWKFNEILIRTVMILMGTLPLLLFHFQMFSNIGLFANLVAIPVVHLILISFFPIWLFSDIPLLGPLIIQLLEGLISFLFSFLSWLAQYHWAIQSIPKPSLLQIVFYYICLAFLVFQVRKKSGWRPMSSAVILYAVGLVLVLNLFPIEEKKQRLDLLSSGRNQIVIYQDSLGKAWLINTGRANSGQAQWTIIPFLRSQGINRLEGVIITRNYKKYKGGLQDLLRNVSIKNVYVPDSLIMEAKEWMVDSKQNSIKRLSELKNLKQLICLNDNSEICILGVLMNEERIMIVPDYGFQNKEELREVCASEKIRGVILPSISRRNEELWKGLEACFSNCDLRYVLSPHVLPVLQDHYDDASVYWFNAADFGQLTYVNGEIHSYLDKR